MKKTLCIIGLERKFSTVVANSFREVMSWCMICFQSIFVSPNEKLFIEKSNGAGFVLIDIVVYHGIFENDFDFLTALSFWGGPCLPNSFGMNCRLKLPCLSRASRITSFCGPREMIPKD